jgi:hypothetical protein
MRKELEPMEQAFTFLKFSANEIEEYRENMMHGRSPYHSLRLIPAEYGSPAKARRLDTNANTEFLSQYNLGTQGLRLPKEEIINRLYGGVDRLENSPLPLLDPVTGQSLSGRFVFPAEALSFSPNLTERGFASNADDGNFTIFEQALQRANPDVLPTQHQRKLNLYGFEGINPQRFGTNVQPEGIIYGDLDESQVHQLNDNPLHLYDISQASRLLNPLVDARAELGDMKENTRKRIQRAAQALMMAGVPPILMDPENLAANKIWSMDDPKLAEPMGHGDIQFMHDPFQQWDMGSGMNTEDMHRQVTHGAMSPEQLELLDHDLLFASEPMDIAMRLLKAYLPTLQERGRKIDDQVSLRWIPRYHESTFHAPVPFHSSRGNVNWEQRLQNEKLKAPKDSAHSQRKTLPGVFEGDSKTPSNEPITGSWVAPATQQGAMGADVSFNDKGLLMAIDENPDWWRTVQQGAAQESPGGEGFKYGGFDKEAFSKIPTPNISPISMLHYQMALESPMLEEDEVAQRFPDEHELITQFPNIKTEDIWGPPADSAINPLKVASEPMDLAMRLLKRQTNLGEHHQDFPSPYGPVVAYHGTTGDDARKIMGGDGLKTHSDNYRTISTNPSEALSYGIDRSVGHRGGGTHSEPKLLAIRQAAFDQNHPNYIGPSHNFKTAQRQTVDFSDATHYGGNIPRQFLTNTPITNPVLENTAQARTNNQNDINIAMSRPALSTRGQIAQRENTEIDTPKLQQTNQRGEVRPKEPSSRMMRWGRNREQIMDDYNQRMAQYMQPNPVVQPTDPNQQQLPLQQPQVQQPQVQQPQVQQPQVQQPQVQQPQVQQPQVQQPQVQQPQMIQQGEPMDLAMQLLKERVSPEAKRHKLEYDKKYESSPERVKYREELNRERRRRHIMGQGGPDMSHTRQHTIVPEDPHTNRARHFKDKGTLL